MEPKRHVVTALGLAEQVMTAALRARRPSQRAGAILCPVDLRIIAAGITAVTLYGVGVLIQKLRTAPAHIATRMSGALTMSLAPVNRAPLTD
jgi:hypothetical protein